MRKPVKAVPAKVSHSLKDKRENGMPFGDNPIRVPSIEELAGREDGYDAQLAYVLSVISTWAYADEKALTGKLRYYGIRGARVRRMSIENNALLVVSTAYLVLSENGKVGVLAFRGTDPANLIMLLADAQVMQRPFRGAKVHAGFHANVEALWDGVSDALEAAREGFFLDESGSRVPLKNPMTTLYVTGHSLGGAMAVLATSRLFGDGYESWKPRSLVRGVYTFGQPMVGDEAFATLCDEEFGKRLFRHVYREDIAPHLPPKSGLSYWHCGPERRSDNLVEAWRASGHFSRRASLAQALIEVIANAVELRFVANRRLGGYSIDDHMPENYLQVARHSADPSVAAAVPTSTSWIDRLIKPAIGLYGVARHGASSLSQNS